MNDDLAGLARSCLAADGGLPLFAGPGMLGSRFPPDLTRQVHRDGQLVAAAGLVRDDVTATVTGMVHPDHRGRGHGSALLAWARVEAGGRALRATSESVTPQADALFALHGLHPVFSEWVMRHDLVELPQPSLPAGVQTTPVSQVDRAALFAAYEASFGDRPGFPDPEPEEWLDELFEDPDYRQDASLLAQDGHGQPIGFLNVLDTWIDQVGVVPSWRGRGLGAALVGAALGSLRTDRATAAWLCVNVDNPAADLYRRLGFAVAGRRARYAATTTSSAGGD